MNIWLWSAIAMLAAFVPCTIACGRGELPERLAGLEAASALATLELVLLAQAFRQSFLYDLPLMLALLSFGGGLVYARFAERWL